MTSEFDIPGQILYLIKKRVTDPIALRGIEELQNYFSSLHTWSHEFAQGKVRTPPCALGHNKVPKTDHWMSMYKPLAVRIQILNNYLDGLLQLERQTEQAKKEMKCLKETGLCFCPTCCPQLHSQ